MKDRKYQSPSQAELGVKFEETLANEKGSDRWKATAAAFGIGFAFMFAEFSIGTGIVLGMEHALGSIHDPIQYAIEQTQRHLPLAFIGGAALAGIVVGDKEIIKPILSASKRLNFQ